MGIVQTVRDWFRGGRQGGMAAAMMGGSGDAVPWPPIADVPRLKRYARNDLLYFGKHREVFVASPEFLFTCDPSREYLVTNLLGALTDLLVSRQFADGVTAEVPSNPEAELFLRGVLNDAWLNELIEAGQFCSALGDVCWKARYDADEQAVKLDCFHPSLWFPDMVGRGRTLQSGDIAQVVTSDRRQYLWIERHEMRGDAGWIVNRLHPLRGTGTYLYRPNEMVPLNSIPQTAGLPDEQPTGVDELLVVQVRNRRGPVHGWGWSDYESLLSIQGELNHRRTQRGKVLDEFVEPLLTVPQLFHEFDENGNRLPVSVAGMRVMELTEADAKPEIITWDASLGSAVEELRDLTEQFAHGGGVDLEALLSQVSGAPASGRAIRLRQQRTQTTVKERWMRWEPGLKRLFSIATKLAASVGPRALGGSGAAIKPVEPEEIKLSYGDGLPKDNLEVIEEQATLLNAGMQSKKRAIEQYYGLSEEEAQALLEEIGAEAGGSGGSGLKPAVSGAAGAFGFAPLATAPAVPTALGGTAGPAGP
jgi:hypothetical protein